jgi:hypothetical protein
MFPGAENIVAELSPGQSVSIQSLILDYLWIADLLIALRNNPSHIFCRPKKRLAPLDSFYLLHPMALPACEYAAAMDFS